MDWVRLGYHVNLIYVTLCKILWYMTTLCASKLYKVFGHNSVKLPQNFTTKLATNRSVSYSTTFCTIVFSGGDAMHTNKQDWMLPVPSN
jgi:hypothetical protein